MPGYKKYYLKSPIKTLLLSYAHLSKLPDAMGYMENLEYLDLSYNKIEQIPASFKKMKKLKILLLMGNPITKEEQEKIKKMFPACEVFF